MENYLVIDELMDDRGPWVLLDGYIRQEIHARNRSIFIFPRGFIAQNRISTELVHKLENQDLGGRWLPEIPEDYYTFVGEIPWSDTYEPNGECEFRFYTGETQETKQVEMIFF